MNTAEQKELTLKNLRKVLVELPELAKKIPSIKTDFTMQIFGYVNDLSLKKVKAVISGTHACNTRGCLLGNAARLFPIDNIEYLNTYTGWFDYSLFGEDNFPYLYPKDEDGDTIWGDDDDEDWHFLFGQFWNDFQPTFNNAMQRLAWYLHHEGNLPKWSYRKTPFYLPKAKADVNA